LLATIKDSRFFAILKTSILTRLNYNRPALTPTARHTISLYYK
jgi:hypothetical protein